MKHFDEFQLHEDYNILNVWIRRTHSCVVAVVGILYITHINKYWIIMKAKNCQYRDLYLDWFDCSSKDLCFELLQGFISYLDKLQNEHDLSCTLMTWIKLFTRVMTTKCTSDGPTNILI